MVPKQQTTKKIPPSLLDSTFYEHMKQRLVDCVVLCCVFVLGGSSSPKTKKITSKSWWMRWLIRCWHTLIMFLPLLTIDKTHPCHSYIIGSATRTIEGEERDGDGAQAEQQRQQQRQRWCYYYLLLLLSIIVSWINCQFGYILWYLASLLFYDTLYTMYVVYKK